jgi:hypothetical protein
MTARHFEALAAELKRQDPRPYDPAKLEWSSGAYREWATLVLGIADVCRTFNPSFDRQRFLRACGLAS